MALARHAGQLQYAGARNGLTACTRLARATDDAAARGRDHERRGHRAGLAGLDAERAFSTRRSAPPADGAVSVRPASSPVAHVDGFKGSLLKGWTITSTLTTEGLPLTPTYLTSVPGTGTMRVDRATGR